MKFVRAVWLWICSWFVPSAPPVRPLKTVYLEELPEILDATVIYIIGEGRHRWFAAFVCPCGCKATLQMSLLPTAKPRWRLIEHPEDGTVSLQPSIWRTVDCRSHFFVQRGLIKWCPPE